ncbi:unnamed protein product [Rotaria sp. Silwood1]|nr:unnamed protein product [Rotaria sp. Silwood1]CAF1583831.1 unnamed protein product [Rotaria sp. Silwood1]CAF3645409.1 unnamed protein product [Rotaria sp. Silwood1]CAF3769678.1 unnamed protein product [Rotaria sp. Silwood1]CAF4712888.1 unnamed protein product [Rotaria sp. Silwood1]
MNIPMKASTATITVQTTTMINNLDELHHVYIVNNNKIDNPVDQNHGFNVPSNNDNHIHVNNDNNLDQGKDNNNNNKLDSSNNDDEDMKLNEWFSECIFQNAYKVCAYLDYIDVNLKDILLPWDSDMDVDVDRVLSPWDVNHENK